MGLRLYLLLIIVALVMMLASCGSPPRKPDLPGPELAVTPTLVTVERRYYVPVPAALTTTEPVAVGAIAECFAVAAERRAALERTNARLREIAGIEGTAAGEATP